MTKNKFIENGKKVWEFYCGFDGDDTNTLQLSFTALIGILIALVKILFGIFLKSAVWGFSGIYSVGLSIVRFLFLKDIVVNASLKKKNQTVLVISIILMISAILFDICAMFRQFQGEMGKPLSVWLVIPLSIYFVVSYALSVIGLFRTRKNKSLSFYAFHVICISGALMNMVLLQRMILSLTSITTEWLVVINSIFSYFIGGTLLVAALILMIRAIFSIKKISSFV